MPRKLPEFNGQPQLWSRSDWEGLRIVWPDGRVTWWMDKTDSYPVRITDDLKVEYDDRDLGFWKSEAGFGACTADKIYYSQMIAVANILHYDLEEGFNAPEFIAYLPEDAQ